MSRMTRKQVKEFVEDLNNWTVIPGNEYVQLAVLEFNGLRFAQIMYRRDVNKWRELTKQDYTPKIEWSPQSYWDFDSVTNTLGSNFSRTYIENRIYERQD